MTHWSSWARWIVAAAGVLFVALVLRSLRPRDGAGTSAPIAPADPRAAVEIVGGTSRQWSGADERFTVKYERQFGYPDGGQRLEGVAVYVDDPEGNRQFVATGREADVSPGQDRVTLKRDVRLVSSGGLTVNTEEAAYSTADKIVRAPGPVTFSRGRMTGRGVGMTYDRGADELWLQAQAGVSVAPDDAGVGALEVSSGSAGLARGSRYLQFERAVQIVHDGRRIQAEQAVGHLSEDEDRLSALDLRGGSRVETAGATPGALKRMQARDISLTYSADGARIERALLAGAGTIALAGEARESDRRIGGEMLDVGLGADGATVTALVGRQRVTLELPGNRQRPGRTIRSGLVDGTPGPDGRLTRIRFSEAVQYEETIGTPPVARRVGAERLDLGMTGGLAGVTDARFTGAVRFAEGALRATADTARYAIERGTIALDGPKGAPAAVADTRMRVEARQILLTMAGPKIGAMGEVRSQLGAAGEAAPDAAAGPGVRMPAFLRADRPVNVTADELDYDGTASRTAYRGSVKLWQGDSAVQADEVVIDTAGGNLSATGSVRSSWLIAPASAPGGPAVAPTATVASAGELAYDEAARRATYTTQAHAIGSQGDLTARVIELYLTGEGAGLERVEGYEAVSLREAGRTTTGDRLSYVAREERYDVHGTPVRIVDGCRESTGRTVTFYKSVDRISIDGQQVSRTRTKSGSGCADPQSTGGQAPGR